MKRVGVLFTRSAWRGVDVAAGIDAALAALAFDHDLSVAFVGAGVELLVGAESGEDARGQSRRMLAGLEHHGARHMLASHECLAARGLTLSLDGCETMPLAALHDWLRSTDHVLCF